jgi:hypothetical protein
MTCPQNLDQFLGVRSRLISTEHEELFVLQKNTSAMQIRYQPRLQLFNAPDFPAFPYDIIINSRRRRSDRRPRMREQLRKTVQIK